MRWTNTAPAFFAAEKLSSMSCVNRVTRSTVRPPVSTARLLLWEQWVDDFGDTSVDESLEDFKGHAEQRYGTIALWAPNGFLA